MEIQQYTIRQEKSEYNKTVCRGQSWWQKSISNTLYVQDCLVGIHMVAGSLRSVNRYLLAGSMLCLSRVVLVVEIYQWVVHSVHPGQSGHLAPPSSPPHPPPTNPGENIQILIFILTFLVGLVFRVKLGNLFSETLNCANISDDKVGPGKKEYSKLRILVFAQDERRCNHFPINFANLLI